MATSLNDKDICHFNEQALSSKQLVMAHAQQGAELRTAFFETHTDTIIEAAKKMSHALANGNKILFCGNGGSAADAQHLAGEFVNRFLLDRPALPAIALSTDTSVLTAIGNDFGFEQIFSKQVQALGQKGDVLVGISTSGNSPNVLAALQEARKRNLLTVGLSGAGGHMNTLCDVFLPVKHTCTPLIQEVHISVGHMLCRLVDYYLFENIAELHASA